MQNVWGWVAEHFDAMTSSALTAAIAGRFVWHVRLVQKGQRGLISWELLFELPTIYFTYIIGIGLAEHLGWTGHAVGATVAVISYFGPAGLQTLAQRYVAMKSVTGRTD